MVDENFVVRFYVDVQQSERDLAKVANRLTLVSTALKDMGVNTKYLDQAIGLIAKQAGAMDRLGTASDANSKAADRLALSNNLVQRAAQGEAVAVEQLSRAQGQAIEMNKRFDAAQQSNIQNLRGVGYELLVTGGIFTRFGQSILTGLSTVVGAAIDYERAFANVTRTTNDGSISMGQLRKELIGLSSEIPVTFEDLAKIATLGGQLGIAGSGIDEFTSVVARLTAVTDLTAEAAGTALGRFQALLGVPSSEFENLASAILKVAVNGLATEPQIVAISTQISSMADFAGYSADQIIGLAGALASVGAPPEISRGTITRTFSLMSKAISDGGESLNEFARISGVSSDEFAKSFGTTKFAPIFQSFVTNLDLLRKGGEDTVITLNNLGISSSRDVPLLLRLAGSTDVAANGMDVLANSMQDAISGYADATELQDQYGIVASTTASRIQLLVSNITNLFDALGSSATGPLSDFVDGLSEVVKGVTEFLNTPFGQNVALFALAITALIGVVVTLSGAVAFAAGTFLLLDNAGARLGLSMFKVAEGATVATVATERLAAAGKLALGFFGKLGGALLAFSVLQAYRSDIDDFETSMKGLSATVDDTIKRLTKPTDPGAFLGLQGLGALAQGTPQTNAANRSLGGFAPAYSQDFSDIAKTDEALRALIDQGNIVEARDQLDALRETSRKFGVTQEQFNAAFPDTINGMKDLAVGTVSAAEETKALEDAQIELEAANERLAASLDLSVEALASLVSDFASGSASFLDFGNIIKSVYEDGQGSALEFSDSLSAQLESQRVWADNLGVLAARGATAFVAGLAPLGPEGAAVAADAVNLTTEELNKLEDNARLAAYLSSEGFAQAFVGNIPALNAAFAQGGISAVQALIAAQREQGGAWNQATVDGVTSAIQAGTNAAKDLPIPLRVDLSPAETNVTDFLRRVNNSSATVRIYGSSGGGGGGGGGGGMATGGYIRGPGTATSDSIHARLSDGEYVIRAASVRKYGTGMFDALNRGVAKFANGGPVGLPNKASSMGIMELGPKSLSRVGGRGGDIIIQVDGKEIARAVNSANSELGYGGSN